MDVIRKYWKRGFRCMAGQANSPLFRLRFNNRNCRPDRIIKVKYFYIDFISLLKKGTQMPNDICCTLIVVFNVYKNLLQKIKIDAVCLEQNLCGLAVCQDCSEWLIELVRD